MLFIKTTERALGIECWGTADDLEQLYEFIGNYWGEGDLLESMVGGYSRSHVLSWFSYDLRKGYEGQRLTSAVSPISDRTIPYVGFQVSWPHMLYTIAALEFNMRYKQPPKLDMLSLIQLKQLLEVAMKEYDPSTAVHLLPFITTIDRDNKYLYHFCRRADIAYFKLGGGKSNFKKLPAILETGSIYSQNSSALYKELEALELEHGKDFHRMDLKENTSIYDVAW